MSASPPVTYNKTRLAPTPSGFLHIGNVCSFAVTAALAKTHGTKILLRVDDIDGPRSAPKYIRDIFDTLNFLGFYWDEGPRNVKEFETIYSQKHRLQLYHKATEQLYNDGLIYACHCSRAKLLVSPCDCYQERQQLPLSTLNINWRLKTNDNDVVRVKGYKGEYQETFLPVEIQNFIVRKKDGFPSYQLTSVIDDLFFNVDLIIRGEDLWPSTLAQHQLAAALKQTSFNEITFYHHKLLNDAAGKKLSKSAGATSIKYLVENGKTPADIFTQIAAAIGFNLKVETWQQLGGLLIEEQV
jgi:glutamyl-tRNA synthetase